LSNKLWWNFCF